jgi:hypothetical protein
MWYESLESQLRWEHYTNLIKIVQPSPDEWRSLTALTDLLATDNKPIDGISNAPKPAPSKE